MFETATVQVRAADRRLLSISIVVHTAIVVAVIAASTASTRLPVEAPRQMMPVIFATPPPALGNPAPVRPAAARPSAPAPPRMPVLRTITAPAVVPDAIQLPAPDTAISSVSAGPGTQDAAGQEGVPWGTPGGVGTQAPPAAPDAAGPLVAGTGGVTSPVVIRRIEPVYPQLALRAHMSGWVVLQCVIDKTGHIRDVRVAHSSFGAFEQPAIDAVQQWLFSPGMWNGQPVDVIFELTVRFEIK